MSTTNTIQEIRKKLYLLRDGASSASMRNKGLQYKVNWGVQVTKLRALAKEYYPDTELAEELWEQETRELKILATLIANPTDFSSTKEWVNSINTGELAEQAVFNLFSNLPDASHYAQEWIQSTNPYIRLSGFLLYIRLFIGGYKMSVPEEKTFLSIATANLDNSELGLNQRILNALYYLEELRDEN